MSSSPFPSRYELKCGGWSLVCANVLWILLGIVYAVISPQDYDASLYEARTEEDVVALHDVLSSESIKASVEASAALSWLSFPLYLVTIYVIKKFYLSLFIGTKVEMWIYVMEKGYLFTLLVVNIIGPALSLVIVSFEWSIHEYTADASDFLPTGYYIQLYSLILVEEIYDAVCITDGLFLFFVCVIPQFQYFTNDPKFNVLKTYLKFRMCRHVFRFAVAISIVIAYLLALFRFADSGFFSLNGGASWLPIYGIIIKFFIGFKLIQIGRGPRYDELDQVFGSKQSLKDDGGSGDDQHYNMETIDKPTQNV